MENMAGVLSKTNADIAAALEKIGQTRGRDWQVSCISRATGGRGGTCWRKIYEILRQLTGICRRIINIKSVD